MQEVSKFDVEISIIPNGLEKYMAFTINMTLYNSSQEFTGEQLKLVKQKGVHPYKYMNSFEKLCLHVFKMSTMGGYHDLYLKTDVFLLAVSEKFICTFLECYGLVPYHYFRNLRLSWDAMI